MELVMHPYHCVLCGTQLYEKALGVLGCGKCDAEFIPTGDLSWEKEHPEQRMQSVVWIENIKTGEPI